MERDDRTRIEFLEEGQRHIVATLSDMRTDQKNERNEVAKAFADLREDLGSRARPFPFREVAGSILTTIAIIGAGISVLNWWYDAKSSTMAQTVSALSLAAAPEELAVLKYRLKLLEARDAERVPLASR